MQRWEYDFWVSPGYLYKQSDIYTEERIKRDRETAWNKVQGLGDDGWEMVNALVATAIPGERENLVFIFKRPIEE